VVRLALVLVAACSGNKARTVDDAVTGSARGDAAVTDAMAIDTPPAPAGDLLVRVEWKTVPVVARASPGRTACNTPRAPAVAPTTTFGIPDVFVFVEGMTGTGEARVVLADCALAPRVVAGATLVVESAVTRPAKLAIAKRSTGTTQLVDGQPRAIQLPIAGHQVQVPLEAHAFYELAFDTETAWVVAGAAGITDASGAATIEGLSVGNHPVVAWLPPRSGQPARTAQGSVTITADTRAELTLELK
jgi:hypothetical protein